MGRRKIQIDYEMVNSLAKIACTEEEIAATLGISVRTLLRDKEFCQTYKKGLDIAKTSLRRAQMKAALSGNTTMQIWLGKQMLNQKDPDKVKNQETADKQGVTIINDLPKADQSDD